MTEMLDKLIRMFGKNGPKIRVGILTNSPRYAKRAGDEGAVSELGNADVGAKHEFGIGVPQRSWLRMPLETHLEPFLKIESIDEETLKDAIKEGTMRPVAESIAVAAKACVLGAFETGGYGQWAPHAPGYENATGEILVDTEQLKNAVSSEVED